MKSVRQKTFHEAVTFWSSSYAKRKGLFELQVAEMSCKLQTKESDTSVEWSNCCQLAQSIQVHMPFGTMITVIEEKSTNFHGLSYTHYYIFAQGENTILYGGKLVKENEYTFCYHRGIYVQYSFRQVIPDGEWKLTMNTLQQRVEQAFKELPEYRLYDTTGMLIFR